MMPNVKLISAKVQNEYFKFRERSNKYSWTWAAETKLRWPQESTLESRPLPGERVIRDFRLSSFYCTTI